MIEKQTVFQPGLRPRLFLGESQTWLGGPLARAVLELAGSQGIAGASVRKGSEGRGPDQFLSPERLPDVTIDLPESAQIVEREEAIARRQPLLDHMVGQGIITTSPARLRQRGVRP